MGIPLYILSNGAKYSNFSISSPTLVIFYLFVCLIVAIPIGMREYLTVVLTCISSMISNAKHHFICLWPFVYVLWRKVYSSPLLIFNQVFSFFAVGVQKFLIYSGYWPLLRYKILNYFLPFPKPSFHSVHGFPWQAEVFTFGAVPLVCSCFCHLWF